MAADGKPVRPIIVIKKKVSHGGHHGGAWKVAYADFVTAMMSLFIVLWLMNSTPKIKKAVAGYFNDPNSSGHETGTTEMGSKMGSSSTISVDQQNMQKLKDQIEAMIMQESDLHQLSNQILITITNEGLRMDLLENKGSTFFESGSSKLSPSGTKLLTLIAAKVKLLPNKLLIEGYTDAAPFSNGSDYTNWELSADRANAVRRLMQHNGVGSDQVAEVRGYGDQMLRVPSRPLDPSNRRVSLIVKWQDGPPVASIHDNPPPEKTRKDEKAMRSPAVIPAAKSRQAKPAVRPS
jgi:chemotaxis protein MotB